MVRFSSWQCRGDGSRVLVVRLLSWQCRGDGSRVRVVRFSSWQVPWCWFADACGKVFVFTIAAVMVRGCLW